MNIYDNYLSTIREAIDLDKRKKNISKGLSGFRGIVNESSSTGKFYSQKVDMTPFPSFLNFVNTAGLTANVNQKLGAHPDFVHLRETNQTENHYIVSVFIDIKGSTNLFRNYDLDTILVITNTIQRAAIHTCVAFGGYIHRLQGDGVFVYFGGKAIDKKDANLKAMTACSMFTYFVKNDLKKIFDQDGIEDISTRIGIDFGDDEKVMWAKAGIGECCEITTYSLHTNLASKMQGWAKPNGIVVGDNVKIKSSLSSDLFSLVIDSDRNVSKRYIFEDRNSGFLYTQYVFDWFKYLKNLPYIKEDDSGLSPISKEDKEKERLSGLRQTASLINTGAAFTDSFGKISDSSSGVRNEPHRFHCEE
ncbi:MAG: adenylate/guanylate cyclase domain-containing protein [Flammeovirgaceae bacterium]